MNPRKMTDEELAEALKAERKRETDAHNNVKVLINESLRRRRGNLDDGYWTPQGYVPKS